MGKKEWLAAATGCAPARPRGGGDDYEWECMYYELEDETVSKIIYMTEYEGVSGEIAT
jgi:hypothetical protein